MADIDIDDIDMDGLFSVHSGYETEPAYRDTLFGNTLGSVGENGQLWPVTPSSLLLPQHSLARGSPSNSPIHIPNRPLSASEPFHRRSASGSRSAGGSRSTSVSSTQSGRESPNARLAQENSNLRQEVDRLKKQLTRAEGQVDLLGQTLNKLVNTGPSILTTTTPTNAPGLVPPKPANVIPSRPRLTQADCPNARYMTKKIFMEYVSSGDARATKKGAPPYLPWFEDENGQAPTEARCRVIKDTLYSIFETMLGLGWAEETFMACSGEAREYFYRAFENSIHESCIQVENATSAPAAHWKAHALAVTNYPSWAASRISRKRSVDKKETRKSSKRIKLERDSSATPSTPTPTTAPVPNTQAPVSAHDQDIVHSEPEPEQTLPVLPKHQPRKFKSRLNSVNTSLAAANAEKTQATASPSSAILPDNLPNTTSPPTQNVVTMPTPTPPVSAPDVTLPTAITAPDSPPPATITVPIEEATAPPVTPPTTSPEISPIGPPVSPTLSACQHLSPIAGSPIPAVPAVSPASALPPLPASALPTVSSVAPSVEAPTENEDSVQESDSLGPTTPSAEPTKTAPAQTSKPAAIVPLDDMFMAPPGRPVQLATNKSLPASDSKTAGKAKKVHTPSKPSLTTPKAIFSRQWWEKNKPSGLEVDFAKAWASEKLRAKGENGVSAEEAVVSG